MSEFDKIDTVPWSSLHHAYGPATDVPDLLKALMTPELVSPALREIARKNKRSVFDQVTWELWGNVFHQGSVWQVTATVVPFIAAILRDGPNHTECKVFLIQYLHHLGVGYPEDTFPKLINPNEAFAAVAGLHDPGVEPDYSLDDNRTLIWMRDSYEAVERQIDVVLPFIEVPDDDLAEAAIALCGSFSRCAERTLPRLRRLASEGGRRGANAAVSLAVLEGPGALNLSESIAESPDRLTATFGACAAALTRSSNISPHIVATLTMPLDALAQYKSAHASTLSNLVGRSLMRLGPDYRERAAAAICQQLAAARPLESLSLTQSLLQLVFENPPCKRASALSDIQRWALEAIRDHGAFKVKDGIFANYGSLLKAWGLPQSAEEISSWLRGS